MTITVFLFLLLGTEPAPVFALLDQFKSVEQCKGAIKALDLPKEKEKRLSCAPIITSPIKDT